jgi:hypothetical protein
MSKKKSVVLIFIFTVLVSCSKQKIIPENTLVEIIYNMHITDAVLSNKESSLYSIRDSMRIYEPVIEKYGYNIEDLRRTFLKYATKDGKLQAVHDKVIKKLEAEKTIYQPMARIEKLSENMTIGADSVYVKSRTFSKRNIDVKLSEQGVYDISANYFFFKNDSTKNPKMIVWLESVMNKDSIMDKQEIQLVKDSVFTDYSARVRFNKPNYSLLKIYWLDFDENLNLSTKPVAIKPANVKSKIKKPADIKKDTVTKQHFIIKKMTVKYNFEESESDSIKLKENIEFVGPTQLIN